MFGLDLTKLAYCAVGVGVTVAGGLLFRRYFSGALSNDEEEICGICLEGLRDSDGFEIEETSKMKYDEVCPGFKSRKGKLGCGHEFHTSCIKQWVYQNSSCPQCRAPVPIPRCPTSPNCAPRYIRFAF